MKKNVLVTSAWLRSSYAVMRSLSARGIPVYTADTSYLGMCQWSIKNKGHSIYRSYYKSEVDFISDLLRIVEKKKIDLIFPAHDETEVIAKYKHLFPEGTCDLIPDQAHCELFNNKKLSYNLAQKLNLNVPYRFDYDQPEEILSLDEAKSGNHFVVKLLKSNSSKGVFHCKNKYEVFNKISYLKKKYELTENRMPQVEKSVPGSGWGNSALYWNGKKIASFTHKRLLEKIDTGGTSTLRVAAEHSLLSLTSEKLLNEVKYHGLAMVEFKVCEETNQFWYIEVNPRLWGSLPLAVAAGLDFPYAAYLCACDGPVEAKKFLQTKNIKINWVSRWFLGDLFRILKSNNSKGALFSRSNSEKLKVNSYDDLFLDDPFVFVGQFLRYLQNAFKYKSTNPEVDGMVR